MNAREHTTTRPGALGRGLDTLMGSEETAPESEKTSGTSGSAPDNKSTNAPRPDGDADAASDALTEPLVVVYDHAPGKPLAPEAPLVAGLIAGGAAGAVAVGAFALLGVKAVLSMQRHA